MRNVARLLLAGLFFLGAPSATYALQDRVEEIEAGRGISGQLSRMNRQRLTDGRAIGVIVMLRDEPYLRTLREIGDARGLAARDRLEESQARVLRDAFGDTDAAHTLSHDRSGASTPYAEFPLSGGFAIRASASEIIALSEHQEVEAVYEDTLSAPQLNESVDQIGVRAVWGDDNEGHGEVVAILDTGVSPDHVMTQGAIIASGCFSSNVAGASTSLCRGGVERLVSMTDDDLAEPCLDVNQNPIQGAYGCRHGTHVASIAAGRASVVNVEGEPSLIQGVAPAADILAVQIFSLHEQEACQEFYPGLTTKCALSYSSDMLSALEWIYSIRDQLNIAAINISVGGEPQYEACVDDPRRTIIQHLRQAGILTVASSGNDGSFEAITAPACIPEVLAVGSVRSNGNKSQFSNLSRELDYYAPGEDILAAVYTDTPESDGNCELTSQSPGADGLCSVFAEMSGTSMAAPHLTGALALIGHATAGVSPDEIEEAMTFTGTRIHAADTSEAVIPDIHSTISVLSNRGLLAGGVLLHDLVTYAALNESADRNSFNTQDYYFRNVGESGSRYLTLVSAPDWIDIAIDSTTDYIPDDISERAIRWREGATLTFSINPHAELISGAADTVVIGVVGSDEVFEIPVSIRLVGELERPSKSVELGPWMLVGDASNPLASIFRLTGFERSIPHQINVAISGAANGEFAGTFSDCSITPRQNRYQGSEYLILRSDLADCGAFGRGMLTFQVFGVPEDVDAGIGITRFFLDGSGALSDSGFDPRFVYDEPDALETSVVYGGRAAGLGETASPSDESLQRMSHSSLMFDWVTDGLISPYEHRFVFQGLEDVVLQNLQARLVFVSDGEAGLAGARNCTLPIDPDRQTGGEYSLSNHDLVEHCGPFGRADIIFYFSFDAPRGFDRRSIEVERVLVSESGGISDLYFGYEPIERVVPNRCYDGQCHATTAEVVWGPFHWTGDANAPTQSVFRLAGIEGGKPYRIDVKIENALYGDYEGEFSDCALSLHDRNASNWDYIITAEDLRECGDFGRADLTFRIRVLLDSLPSSASSIRGGQVYLRRMAIGAHGDVTNFTFDNSYLRNPLSRTQMSESRTELLSNSFDWVGDADAGTQSVFRLSGISQLPTEIQIAFSDASANSEAYQNDFTDCSLEPDPKRMDGQAYLITPTDMIQCGEFVRANLRFRFVLAEDDPDQTYTLRRFAVTRTGGLTDFASDTRHGRWR